MRVAALYDVHGNLPALEAVLADPRCHATPRSDEEIVTRLTPDDAVAAAFAGSSWITIIGHTHVQFDRRLGHFRAVNAGSVGSPYEGRSGAFWALLHDDVELVHTDYDAARAAETIRATGFRFADDLASTLLEPATAEEATEFFEAQRRGA